MPPVLKIARGNLVIIFGYQTHVSVFTFSVLESELLGYFSVSHKNQYIDGVQAGRQREWYFQMNVFYVGFLREIILK